MAARIASAPRFGVEEEFLLLDAETGLPRDGVMEIAQLRPELPIELEFFHSQIETATPVCERAEDALEAILGFRGAVAETAGALGLVLAGTGLPPIGGDAPGRVVPKPRYLDIHRTMRGMVTRYYSTGTHVHVEVPSRDAGVEVIARIAPWSPALLALTANSPIWLGGDSGYASWRFLSIQQWPSSGYPPRFADAAEYEATVQALVRAGALMDTALVNWSIRLSERYPTVELRTADAQLRGEDAVDFALLLRALVARALRDAASGAPAPGAQRDVLRGAHWLAARNGLGSELVHPAEGAPHPAFDVIDALLAHAEPELEAAGDLARVHAYLARRRKDLGGAQQQRTAWEAGGIRALLELYGAGHAPG
ncbi:YbdK family carboxylate-amine ligase [Leucobacter allii]|uniref:Putative glutamate--cysteine ligase 2 n=1 Tax=Leucobacter allii TaxID=2932247 RepID=A0ABY4FPX8_9MICO|nr:YbdK family carboxylate-amine ligase [Leucobacter allii]UOQ58317.1 YbdK family carboxylate-amine ligase [Leucobacter allii]